MIEAAYEVPYLAHATMEPMSAAARIRDGALEIWAGSQVPVQAGDRAAAAAGVEADRVTLHVPYLGGGFGRRAETDFVETAARVAAGVPGRPVLVTWSREEDMRRDCYRPMARARMRAAVGPEGPRALDLRLACPSVMAGQMARLDFPQMGPDATIVQGAWEQPFALPHYRVAGHRADPLLPVGAWRAVGASQNGFFHESAMDEIAHAAGRDPLEMRLALVTDGPSRRVLEAVGTLSDWGMPLPAGAGRGLAFVLSFGVPTAAVVEVADGPAGLRLTRAAIAVDVGTALDPGNVAAQAQSGLLFGLGTAIEGKITVAGGAPVEGNFDAFPVLRMDRAPQVSVRVLETQPKLRGIGEPGVPPAAPALANAVFAATGRRIRRLPLAREIRFA